MKREEMWLTVALTAMGIGVGKSLDLPLWATWVPFGATLLAGATWEWLVGKWGWTESGKETAEPEPEGIPLHTGNKTTYLSEGQAQGPMLLEECETLLIAPKGGGSIHLDTPAVTMAEFVRRGWLVNFSVTEMSGMILADGLKTKVAKNGNWAQWTDALAQAKLIRKQKGAPTVSLLSLRGMLEHISPFPQLDGWRGWYR